MKKKNHPKLKLTKIKVSALNSTPTAKLKGQSLVTTQFISCGETFWVC
ncbi:hypothetical protein CLV59_10696 [Chitinophaga dinghuensis]|uniref:Uncharacterized protein n=1 Tax=Chitinophaga dinghuensis TaxID=1539050 RepID=A0A327VVV6_9BACT|nr:hypothetical protein [Chitinophaga dinghuensis]RAJ79036.1 hypothetical protein CLV59_10696 [Chitinophaga dinghuensis]